MISDSKVLTGIGKIIQSTTTWCRFGSMILTFYLVLRAQKLDDIYFEHKLGHKFDIQS